MEEENPFDSTLVLDILLAENDYISQWRTDHNLYHKVYKNGEFIYEQIGEQWRPEINEVITEMFRKKKLKYAMFFLESFKMLAQMKPYTIRVLVYMVTTMRRDNRINSLGMQDICDEAGVGMRYAQLAVKQLLKMDVIRRYKYKNTYNYMVNPAFFTRGTLRSIYTITQNYDRILNKNSPTYEFDNFEESNDA